MTRSVAILHMLMLAGVVSFIQPAMAGPARPLEQIGANAVNDSRPFKPLDFSRDHAVAAVNSKDAGQDRAATADTPPADFRLLGTD